MKRLRISNEGEVEDKINMANVLMLLSRGHHRVEEVNGEKEDDSPMMMSSTLRRRRHEGRVFECKTCNRQFHSFQALGGHRASHRKPTLAQKKPNGKAHECSICGLEFGVGQALGGHMRRHRAIVKMNVNDEAGFRANKKRLVLLDLNLLPPNDDDDDDDDDEMEGSKIGLGMGLELICR